MKNIARILLGLFLIPIVGFKVADIALANHSPFVFFVSPPTVTTTGDGNDMMILVTGTVFNASDSPVTTPICATNLSNRSQSACLGPVTLPARENYTFQTAIPVSSVQNVKNGSIITFSYRTEAGRWHGILNSNHRIAGSRIRVNFQRM